MSIDNIYTVENFISDDEATFLIDYINTNIDKFESFGGTPDGERKDNPNRLALMFGRDQAYWYRTNSDMHLVEDIEPTLRKLFDRITNKVKELTGAQERHVAIFWFAKQKDGAYIASHIDSYNSDDFQVNPHFTDSILIYLNTLPDGGGDLVFTDLEYRYTPKAKDLVMFPAQGEQYRHEVLEIKNDRYSLAIWLTDDKYFAL